jgi:hypothetical protein
MYELDEAAENTASVEESQPVKKTRTRRIVAPRGAKTARKPAMSGTAFIRTLPLTLSVQQVIAAGAKKGITFSRNLVYFVRSKKMRPSPAKARPRAVRREEPRPGPFTRLALRRDRRAVQARQPAPLIVARGAVFDDDSTVAFRKVAFDIGIARSRELLDDLETRLQEIVDGED